MRSTSFKYWSEVVVQEVGQRGANTLERGLAPTPLLWHSEGGGSSKSVSAEFRGSLRNISSRKSDEQAETNPKQKHRQANRLKLAKCKTMDPDSS